MYLILIVLILGAVIYRGLSSYYAQKLIQSVYKEDMIGMRKLVIS